MHSKILMLCCGLFIFFSNDVFAAGKSYAEKTLMSPSEVREYLRLKHLMEPESWPPARESWEQFRRGAAKPYTVKAVLGFTPLMNEEPKKPGPEEYRDENRKTDTEAAKTESRWGFRGVLLRSSLTDVLASEDVTKGSDITDSTRLVGAKFSYSRNFRKSTDAWSADGIILFPFALKETPAKPSLTLTSAYVLPSVAFKRVTGTDSDDANSLIFRMGAAWTFTGGTLGEPRKMGTRNNWYPIQFYSQTFNLNAAVETDFDFRRKVPSLEFTYTPAVRLGHFVIGNYYSWKNLTLASRIDVSGRVELGRHYQKVAGVDRHFDFARIGPTVGITFDPFFHESLRLGSSIQWLPAVHGPRQKQHLFKAFAQLKLGPSVHLSLDYEEGGTELAKEPVRQLTLGLRVIGTFFAPKSDG